MITKSCARTLFLISSRVFPLTLDNTLSWIQPHTSNSKRGVKMGEIRKTTNAIISFIITFLQLYFAMVMYKVIEPTKLLSK